VTITAFKNPNLEGPTPLTIDGDVVYGHYAAWGTEHIGAAGVTPPRGGTHRYFHLGAYDLDGKEIDVGCITMRTGHAGLRLAADDARKHYEDTGTVAAYVRAGDDEHGGWFCGRLAKNLDDARIEELRGAKVSGDWRGINGRRELIGILAVCTPGFPIPRPRALIAAGQREPLALVACGIVRGDDARLRLRARLARGRLRARLAE
jgi:hypothetical protein